MPLFRRGSDDDREAQQAAAAEQAASLAALERGELPLRAQRRLGEIGKTGGSGLFTSDLSVGEFALAHAIGLRPLAQVMGSSIYHVGWQQQPGGWGMQMGAISQELTVVSEAWNAARLRAFARLEQEATLVGADAVVGVRLTVGSHDWAAGSIEYVAVGTAVRDRRRRARRAPGAHRPLRAGLLEAPAGRPPAARRRRRLHRPLHRPRLVDAAGAVRLLRGLGQPGAAGTSPAASTTPARPRSAA